MIEGAMSDLFMKRDAMISGCGRYRYRLSRHWGSGPEAAFIMLNPSTADAHIDDPTIRRCIGFARHWSMGSLYVGNLFAVRATRPADMMRVVNPVGPDNFTHLHWMGDRAAKNGSVVVCGWRAYGSHLEQAAAFSAGAWSGA
jgi:hypothetical protein